MRFTMFTLADYASVREGLLTVVSSTISQIGKSTFPSGMACYLAAVVEIDSEDYEWIADEEVPVYISVLDSSDHMMAQVDGSFGGPGTVIDDPELATCIPIAMDMSSVILPEAGLYKLSVAVGKGEPVMRNTLRFKAYAAALSSLV